MPQRHFVYILANQYNDVIYVGVTNDLRARVYQHKQGKGSRFTRQYKVNKLVHFETFDFIEDAIKREKQLKGGSRQSKINLVNENNAQWQELKPKPKP